MFFFNYPPNRVLRRRGVADWGRVIPASVRLLGKTIVVGRGRLMWRCGQLLVGIRLSLLRFRSRTSLVVVFRHGGIGDVVCTFPGVLGLRNKHPGAKIVYCTDTALTTIVGMSKCADLVIGRPYSRDQLLRTLSDSNTLPGAGDLVYRPLFFDEGGEGSPRAHLIDAVSSMLGTTPVNRQPELFIPCGLARRVRARVAESRRTDGLVIGVQAGPSWPVREWLPKEWDRLVGILTDEYGATVIQMGADSGVGRNCRRVPRVLNAVDWVGALSLPETAAAISECDLFIGIDSGLLHIAGAVRTPCVGIFGAVDPLLRMPPGVPHAYVVGNVPCSGCHHRTPKLHWETGCPHAIVCMQHISAASVIDACNSIFDGGLRRSIQAGLESGRRQNRGV